MRVHASCLAICQNDGFAVANQGRTIGLLRQAPDLYGQRSTVKIQLNFLDHRRSSKVRGCLTEGEDEGQSVKKPLLPYSKSLDQNLISFEIGFLQIIEESSPLAYQLQ